MGEGAEFDAIRQMLAEWGPHASGIGDDAAVIAMPAGEQLVASTDATVEYVHFRRDWMSPEEIGGRAAAAALSDLAAMGATPRGLLLALGVPESWRGGLEQLARGVGRVAALAGCPIVGGNISAARDLSLTITVLGSAVTPVTRSGARAGDILFVTGRLGGPGAALRSLLAGESPAAHHRARFVAPVPRLREALWLVARGARAAIDISDGLLADAAHLAHASGVSLSLDERAIPCVAGSTVPDAVASGEEYELLVAVPAECAMDTAAFGREFGVELTAIGVVVAAGVRPVLWRGPAAGAARGHDHLRA